MSDKTNATLERLRAATAGKTATAAQTSAASSVKTKTVAAAVAQTEGFEITEAQIKSNPVYAIITDEKLNDKEKLERLEALRAYNQNLTVEENKANAEASNQFLLYVENQLQASAQRALKFTNDDAFSLYDKTVRDLYDNIGKFKGYMLPFAKALEVLQRSREAGVPANELIELVEGMQAKVQDLEAKKAAKEASLVSLEAGIEGINIEATNTAEAIEKRNAALEAAIARKQEAEKSWNVFTKGGKVTEAQGYIDNLNRQIQAYVNTSDVIKRKLEDQLQSIEATKAEIADLGTQVEAAKAEINANDSFDLSAVATLIEITGPDFKEKRDHIVQSATDITTNAVSGIEKSIRRFISGRTETTTQLDTVTNLNGMVSLITTADKKVRDRDALYVAEQKAIVDRIKEAEGDDAIYNPDYQEAKKHLDAANKHVEGVILSAGRAVHLESSLTGQQSTFKALADTYVQKERDATRLRTNAAVQIPAQLVITVKAVETATAEESNKMVSDALGSLSQATQEATQHTFNAVAISAEHHNDELKKAMSMTLDTIEMLNRADAEYRQRAREAYETTQLVDEANKALRDVTNTVATAMVDEDHAARAEDARRKPAAATPRP